MRFGPPFRHGYTVVRLRAALASDGYGGETLSWDDPDRLVIDGCAGAPGAGDENHVLGRDAVTETWTLYGPTADVVARDRVETPHGLFEVDGPPGRWVSPFTGRVAGMTVRLRVVEG